MKALVNAGAAMIVSLALSGCRDASGNPGTDSMTEPAFAATATPSDQGVSYHFDGTNAMDSVRWYSTDASGVTTVGEVTVYAFGGKYKPPHIMGDTVYIIYGVAQFDQYFNQTFCAAGGGMIPASDFRSTGDGAALSTTVSDEMTFCGPPGSIDVTWRKTPLYSSSFFGNWTSTTSFAGSGSTTTHSVGSSSSSSATATGSVVGFVIPATALASVAEGRGMGLDITHP
jgi:hypothetical protein